MTVINTFNKSSTYFEKYETKNEKRNFLILNNGDISKDPFMDINELIIKCDLFEFFTKFLMLTLVYPTFVIY